MLKWFRRESKSPPVAAVGSIEIRRPWARPSSETPGEAGGYFTVTNAGTEPDRLIAAASPAAAKVEIHAIKVMGGDITMRPRENGFAVAGGVTMTLRPRGYHLLLTGLTAPLSPGTALSVTLIFEKAGSIAIDLAVEAPGPVGQEVLLEEAQRG